MHEHLYTLVADETVRQLGAHIDNKTIPERELIAAARDLLECRRVYVAPEANGGK